MDAYAMDLRERVVRACDEGLETREEIAERFDVSTSFIRKLLRRRRESGSIAPRPHAGGSKPSLNENDLKDVRTLVQEKPDATLEELCEGLAELGGKKVRIWTMCRALKKLKLPRKKRRFMPASEIARVFRSSVRSGWRRSGRSRWKSWFSSMKAELRPA